MAACTAAAASVITPSARIRASIFHGKRDRDEATGATETTLHHGLSLSLMDLVPSVLHGCRSVSRIDHKPSVLHDEVPVVNRVIGGDKNAILGGQVLGSERFAGEPRHGVVPHLGQDRDVWIVVADDGTAGL